MIDDHQLHSPLIKSHRNGIVKTNMSIFMQSPQQLPIGFDLDHSFSEISL